MIGIVNTLTDIVLLNILRVTTNTQTSESKKIVILNVISASSVALLSFYLNRKYVFKSEETRNRMFAPFLLITLASIFILQSAIIGLSLKYLGALAESLQIIGSYLPVVKDFSINFYDANLAKLCATLGSMIWNYYFYNKFVFKNSKTNDSF